MENMFYAFLPQILLKLLFKAGDDHVCMTVNKLF